MDASTRMAVVGFVVPAVLGALSGLGAALARKSRTASAATDPDAGLGAPRALAVVGLTIAMFVSLWGIAGKPAWPPADSTQRLFLVPPAVGLIGLAAVLITAWRGSRSIGGRRGLAWILSSAAAGVAAAIGTAIVAGKTLMAGHMLGPILVPLIFGVWSAIAAASLGSLVRTPGPTRVSGMLVLVGLAAATGAAVMGNGIMTVGQIGLGVAAACAGLVVGAVLARGSIGPGATAAACAMMGVLLADGQVYGELPWWVVATLACVGPAAVAADCATAQRSKLLRAIAPVVAAAIVALIAIGPGIWSLIAFVLSSPPGE
jgi:hypothetical protein